MIAQDIVNRLSAKIPLYTGDFSDSVGITSISVLGTTATVTTDAAHGLVDGRGQRLVPATIQSPPGREDFIPLRGASTYNM